MRAEGCLPYPLEHPDEIDLVTNRVRGLAVRADRVADAVARDRAQLLDSWSGLAAGACEAELDALTRVLAPVTAALPRAAVLLRAYHRSVTLARARVDALRRGYDDVHPADDLLPGRWQAAHDAVLRDLAADAAGVGLGLARLADEVVPGRRSGGTAPAAALVRELPLLAAQRRLLAGGLGKVPATSTSPAQARAWWGLLTPEERERFVWTGPRRLGRLRGIPVADRSRANELVLGRLLVRLAAQGSPSELHQRLLASCRVVRDQLARVRSDLDPLTGAPTPAQLVLFQPQAYDGEGRVVLAVGAVDSAANVAVLVPGVGADLSSGAAGLVTSARAVRLAAQVAEPGRDTAVLAWVGYDAPEGLDVARSGAAHAGADRLARDLSGLTSATGFAQHLTVVGHSYGSLVVGSMLREHRTAVSDVVLLGSPGVGAPDPAALRVRDDHLFVGASSRDPVSYLRWFGPDPAGEEFGAVRFRAEDPSRHPWRLDPDDHSRYFRLGGESLANIGRVVAGEGAGVELAPYREGVPWFFAGINDDPETTRRPSAPDWGAPSR